MLRSIGKQSGESVESVLKKKKKTTVGRIWAFWADNRFLDILPPETEYHLTQHFSLLIVRLLSAIS